MGLLLGSVPLGIPPKLKKKLGALAAKNEKSSAPVTQVDSETFSSPAAFIKEGKVFSLRLGHYK